MKFQITKCPANIHRDSDIVKWERLEIKEHAWQQPIQPVQNYCGQCGQKL